MRDIPAQQYEDLETLQKYNVNLESRSIYLFGEESSNENPDGGEPGVEYIMANRFIKNLHFLVDNANGDHSPIIVHMKTCGGHWEEGMAIYDAIRSCPIPVHVLSYTHARSMSGIILQAADYRVMMPHSYFLFHHGTYAASGEMVSVFSGVDYCKSLTPIMLDIYAEAMIQSNTERWKNHTNKTVTEWLVKQMEQRVDVYLTPTETVDCGLADSIFDGNWEKLSLAK